MLSSAHELGWVRQHLVCVLILSDWRESRNGPPYTDYGGGISIYELTETVEGGIWDLHKWDGGRVASPFMNYESMLDSRMLSRSQVDSDDHDVG
jgi:hypothetical protein